MVDATARFRAKYIVRENGCWEWIAGKYSNGYGSFSYNGKDIGAHVFAWLNVNGRYPEKDKLICHTCNNRLCVNPSHLYEGTRTNNHSDAIKAGTHYPASRTHCLYGHPYEGDNLGIRKTGGRVCRICARERNRAYDHRKNGGFTRPKKADNKTGI